MSQENVDVLLTVHVLDALVAAHTGWLSWCHGHANYRPRRPSFVQS